MVSFLSIIYLTHTLDYNILQRKNEKMENWNRKCDLLVGPSFLNNGKYLYMLHISPGPI